MVWGDGLAWVAAPIEWQRLPERSRTQCLPANRLPRRRHALLLLGQAQPAQPAERARARAGAGERRAFPEVQDCNYSSFPKTQHRNDSGRRSDGDARPETHHRRQQRRSTHCRWRKNQYLIWKRPWASLLGWRGWPAGWVACLSGWAGSLRWLSWLAGFADWIGWLAGLACNQLYRFPVVGEKKTIQMQGMAT